ncbi:hypothetical protein GPECTOR_1g283 [Gonium pectorale]|uniref:Uncharacterized protein n=1 Tax=Gonium pectorale TaxID=33097 RepID=A0A150H2L9_GONPE|nr:hypothetical protein GPECTOR_1g283 [Gonium pectorale]|eukprot:KXZ56321.1 hypothetical protein GPECTOR_1g283 [Gonium pectorale]
MASLSGMQFSNLYVGARINTKPYDLPFTKDKDGRMYVVIHGYNGTSTADEYSRTVLQSTLSAGMSYNDPYSGLFVEFESWSAADAPATTTSPEAAAATTPCAVLA